MQAKDISTAAFVRAVVIAGMIRESRMTVRWDVQAVLAGHPELVGCFFDRVEIDRVMPEKVVMAKAKKLIRQRILTGCDCGCRGDYEVVPDVAASLGLVPAPGDPTGSLEPYGYWMLPELGSQKSQPGDSGKNDLQNPDE